MEFEDQGEHEEEEEEEEEIELPSSFDSFGNTARPKMPSPGGVGIDAPPMRKPRYRECLKNHAVGIGGHALDGCGEFIAAGAEGTLDGLKCAACNCHRNFHRKEPDSGGTVEAFGFGGHQYLHSHQHHHHQLITHHPPGQFSTPYYRGPSGYLHVAPQARPLALPSSSGGGLRDDQEDMSNPNNVGGFSKKRFRTKFTPEQKEKMLSLAERLGWRIQKQDEEIVQEFCNETGVRRQVLKVWMHNNKHSLGKKPYNNDNNDNTPA